MLKAISYSVQYTAICYMYRSSLDPKVPLGFPCELGRDVCDDGNAECAGSGSQATCQCRPAYSQDGDICSMFALHRVIF